MHQAVAATQAALLPNAFAQLQQAGQQLADAQKQLQQAGEVIGAKNSHIEARNAENTALKTKIDALVARFGPDAEAVLADLAQPPVESEGGETA